MLGCSFSPAMSSEQTIGTICDNEEGEPGADDRTGSAMDAAIGPIGRRTTLIDPIEG